MKIIFILTSILIPICAGISCYTLGNNDDSDSGISCGVCVSSLFGASLGIIVWIASGIVLLVSSM